ncbi:MAG: hypothetical protein LBK95_19990 [Bifidobacteriaceae bacterium]|jgi:hypothetical protein|nr:hypothetical protein [Bifidobacteriaceae bacterium]
MTTLPPPPESEPPEIPRSTGEECHQLLADALAALASAKTGVPVTGTASALGRPDWDECRLGWNLTPAWLAPLDLEFEAEGYRTTAQLKWPVPGPTHEGRPPPAIGGIVAASPGRHSGLWLGGPLSAGMGVRLRSGLHVIPRPSGAGWKIDVVIASLLGPDVFGNPDKPSTWENLAWAALGKLPGRYADQQLVKTTLFALGLEATERNQTVVVAALKSARDRALDEPAGARPSRTAASRNRLFGTDEVMAELVYSRFGMVNAPERRSGQRGDDQVAGCLDDTVWRAAKAAGIALTALAGGQSGVSSVVTRTDSGATLARIEQAARTCFIGFRGLGKIRGRADLRDLEPGWSGTLCPVQTPESTDTGLVRFAAVGSRADAPEGLADWYDLSASAALIPFVNHDDPARASIGSKNLKQAVPVAGCEPPLIATGWEHVLGMAQGVAISRRGGIVTEVGDQQITVATSRGPVRISYGAPWTARSGPDNTWFVDVAKGEEVSAGRVVAHAPDVRIRGEQRDRAQLCLGVNALVALTPWHGLNYEDGIVVSEAFAERMTSTHIVRVDQPKPPGHPATQLVWPGATEPTLVSKDETVLLVTGRDGRTARVCSPVAGELLDVFDDPERCAVSFLVRVERPLAVGDKLSNRHQGKGVVSAILPVSDMPRLAKGTPHLPAGTPVEVILNPVGVLRRLNIGQLWEMHTGLAAMLAGSGSRRAGRVIADPAALAEELDALGAPRGRMKLTMLGGALLGGDNGVVVGPQYIVKLDHLASSKLSVHGPEPRRSPLTAQPAKHRWFDHDHWVGAAQSLGEMEVWALEAAGATEVLADALRARSATSDWATGKPRASLRAVQAHLAVAGLGLGAGDGPPRPFQELAREDVGSLTPVWQGTHYPELPGWRDLGHRDKATVPSLLMNPADESNGPVAGGSEGTLNAGLSSRASTDPLSGAAVHGEPGSPEREQVRWAIPLPHPVPHPWRKAGCPALPQVTSVPVLPPAFRASAPGVERQGMDKAYQDLAALLIEHERLAGTGLERQADLVWARVQRALKAILGVPQSGNKQLRTQRTQDTIWGRLSGKRGLLRRYLLGQATTFSGRSVIVPDLALGPAEVGLPRTLAAGLGVNGLEPHGDVVIVNRQPSLHPYNMVALRAIPVEGDAIHLHPLVLAGLAGDFDGDTVAVHRPVTGHARGEAWMKLSPTAVIRSAANGQVLAKMGLDIALGLYLASVAEPPCLPASLGTDAPVLDAESLPTAVDGIVATQADGQTALAALVELEQCGFDTATGWSIGALDLLADSTGGRLAEAVAAGAAGKPDAVRQLLDRRGEVAAGHPLTPVRDVSGCFLGGLTNSDYFSTATGSLASLAEKKLTSPHAGALTKTLVEVADAVVVLEAQCKLPDAVSRSPLTCASPVGVCQSCYGVDPGKGEPPPIGARVGVLAAMLIGERSTQLSMKVFHGGGQSGSLGDTLGELRAVFGQGRSTVFGLRSTGKARNLREYLQQGADLADPQLRADYLQPIAEHASALLKGEIHPVHVHLMLRQLVDTFLELDRLRETAPAGQRSLIACAQARGRSAFEAATSRGNLTWLLNALGEEPRRLGGPRTRLAAGAVS